MFCGKCGAANDDNTFKCVACGGELHGGVQAPAQPVYAAQPTEPVPNYLVQAILLTIVGLMCCQCVVLPTGIVALVFASQVNSKQQTGDYAGAIGSSNNARIWCWISFAAAIIGALLAVVWFVFVLVTGGLQD